MHATSNAATLHLTTELATARASAASAAAQHADQRFRLKQEADNANDRARLAERRAHELTAELAAVTRCVGDALDVTRLRARVADLLNVHRCASCRYAGELEGAEGSNEAGEYCRRCGENVLAQEEAARQHAHGADL